MKSLHEKVRREYEKFRPIVCPALGGETIYFYNSGYAHLIRKGRKFRPPKEVVRRMRLLRFVEDILEDKMSSIIKEDLGEVSFWRISRKCGSQTVILVIRQLGHSPKHFFSIMNT